MLDDQELSNLKKLCRIEYSKEEEDIFRISLNRVLSYIEQITEVDTSSVPTCNYPLKDPFPQFFREDEVKDLLSRDLFLANAPEQIGGMVRVPPVLKEP